MRFKLLPVVAFAIASLTTTLSAQTGNSSPVKASLLRCYMVNEPAANGQNLCSPIPVTTTTDSILHMNVQAFNISHPVLMLFDTAAILGNTIQIDAWNMYGIQIDLRDKGNNGYSEQILFSGWERPSEHTWTNSSGQLTATARVPSCLQQGTSQVCINNPNLNQFEVSTQAIVADPFAPSGLASTPAVQGTFCNAYQEHFLNDSLAPGEDTKVIMFKQSFTFDFYGKTYTQAHLSGNGHISFEMADTTFPNLTVNKIRTGPPRIMSYFSDLVPETLNYQPTTRIYTLQFTDALGVQKFKIVHDHLDEFGAATGPHGGEIVLTENGDISVFVPGYQGVGSINTVVGITPGNSVDPNVPGTGLDLSALLGTNTALGAGQTGFELFPGGNPIDVIGLGNNQAHPIGPGFVFVNDPALPNTAPMNSGYIIQ